MYHNIVEQFVVIASLLLCALAFPAREDLSNRMVVPPEAHRVAFDEINKRLVAFDGEGRHLGHYHANSLSRKKRDGAELTCYPMKEHEIKALPGINELRDYADLHFSNKVKRREVVNDDHEDTREMDALVCPGSGLGDAVEYDANPYCTESTIKTNGTLFDGLSELETEGQSYVESTFTVTKESTLGIEREFSAKLKIGLIWEAEAKRSIEIKFMNRNSHTNRARYTKMVGSKLRELSKDNLECVVTLAKNRCIITGRAHVWLIAKGWLWFEYDKTVGPEGDKHYKWAVHMDRILPDERKRGAMVQFENRGDLQITGEFRAEGCTHDTFETIMPSQSTPHASATKKKLPKETRSTKP